MQIYKHPEKIKVKIFIAAYEEENILENFSFHQKNATLENGADVKKVMDKPYVGNKS